MDIYNEHSGRCKRYQENPAHAVDSAATEKKKLLKELEDNRNAAAAFKKQLDIDLRTKIEHEQKEKRTLQNELSKLTQSHDENLDKLRDVEPFAKNERVKCETEMNRLVDNKQKEKELKE